MKIGSLRRLSSTVRAGDWWLYKIPPLAAIAYAGALLGASGSAGRLAAGGIAIVGICLVAAYGYILNDICDLDEDRVNGRHNRMARLTATARTIALLTPCATLALLGVRFADWTTAALFAANLALPTLYSVRPVRLKERGVIGALADASGVHAVPALIVAWTVAPLPRSSPLSSIFIGSSVGWALFAGLRGIVVHQVADRSADLKAGVRTFAADLSTEAARTLLFARLLPIEVTALTLFLGVSAATAPVIVVMVALYLTGEAVKMRSGWRLPLLEPPAVSTERYVPLVNNEFHEVWMPIGLAAALAVHDPRLVLLLLAHVALFFTNIRARTAWVIDRIAHRRRTGRVAAALDARRRRRRAVPLPPIVVGATTWTVNGVNVFSSNLCRALQDAGSEATILLTEENSNLVHYPEARMRRADDLKFESLPVAPYDGWGMHWGRMQRYLEERAPCIYIPNSDWRHSAICPRLPDQVIVVGVVHSDDPLHYDHVRRLGRYWNAIVAVSQTVADRVIEASPELADRVVTIPIGVKVPPHHRDRPSDGERLRVIYHGILKQHQKRVLDLPRIVAAAVARAVPIELSIAGSGPDEAALKAAAAPLVESGHIRFLGLLPPDELGTLLEQHDVYLLASEFEGMPNALLEAMGRGCVPIVSRMKSGIPELIRDGLNGYLVPISDAEAFAARLDAVWKDRDRRRQMSKSAFDTVSSGRFHVEHMAEAYERVFEAAYAAAKAGRFVRPKEAIAPPPASVAGVSIFPVELCHAVPAVGRFPSIDDADDYLGETRRIPTSDPQTGQPAAVEAAGLSDLTVWITAPLWTDNGVNRWSEDLVRGLRRAGVNARLLLTEESSRMINVDDPRLRLPDDLPVEHLTVCGPDGWGARWGAMIRRLETSTPCVYFPNFDWRHAAVIPTLSRGVSVVGVLHDNDPLYLEQAERLADHWDAIIAVNRHVARSVQQAVPALSPLVNTIPYGPEIPKEPRRRQPSPSRDWLVMVLGGSLHPERLASFLRELHRFAPLAQVQVVSACPVLCEALSGAEIDVLPRLARFEWLDLCSRADVVVAAGGGGALWDPLMEAVGNGAVPILIAPDACTNYLFRDRDTAIVVGDHESDRGAIARLSALMSAQDHHLSLIERAHRAVRSNGVTQDEMIGRYLDLLLRIRPETGFSTAPRSAAGILPPPATIGEVSILPVEYLHRSAVGLFPTGDDAIRFVEERNGEPARSRIGPDALQSMAAADDGS